MEIISHGEYGLSWPEKMSKFHAELSLYRYQELRESSPKTLEKHEHFKNAIRLVIPRRYLEFHRWFDRAIESWCYDPIASEWGASSMGKSSDYGIIALFDVMADPLNTLTVIVTNPMERHQDRCFKYSLFYNSLVPKQFRTLAHKKQNPLGLLYDYEKVNKSKEAQGKEDLEPEKRTGIVCHSNKPGDTAEDMKRRIGAHEKRMRLIVDEPQGCGDAVLKLKVNMGAGSGVDFIERFLGNPSAKSDPLGRHSEPKDGDWKKTEYLDEWETKRTHKRKPGKCMVRDGEKSPAQEEPERLGFLFGPDDLADAKNNYGEDSLEYWTYARGRLKGDRGSNVIISEDDLIAKGATRTVVWQDYTEDYVGLDAAAEAGDGNELYRVRVGKEANGRTIVAIVESQELKVDISKPDTSGQIATQVISHLKKWGIPLNRLAGDTTGNQGPIFDSIERMAKSKVRVHRVNASGKCSSPHPIFQGSAIKRCDRYFDRATELVYNVVVALEKEQLVIRHTKTGEVDAKIIHQICTRRREEPNDRTRGKIKVEQKSEWRKRNNKKSPDNFDAIQQVMALLIEQGKLILNEGAVNQSKRTRRQDPMNRGRKSYTERRSRRKNVIKRY